MPKSSGLQSAARARKDEFYTQLTDIEKELAHYRSHFQGKTVFCNCDDPFESGFFRYFVLNFNRLGLKKLFAASYAGVGYRACMGVITAVGESNGIDKADIAGLFKNSENSLRKLHGDGDFRSPESIALLQQADIVVTNPPFSLFREFVAQLEKYQKKFIILGNVNAITYKEFFPQRHQLD